MLIEILGDFALALGHLSDAEFFAALGMSLFGLAAVTLTSRLRNRERHAAMRLVSPQVHDQAA
jgi:hypothetical protein